MSATATQSAKTSVPESDPGSLQSKTPEKGAESEPRQSFGSTRLDASPRDQQKISELAYFYWEAREASHGSAEDDWLRAEQEIYGSVSRG